MDVVVTTKLTPDEHRLICESVREYREQIEQTANNARTAQHYQLADQCRKKLVKLDDLLAGL